LAAVLLPRAGRVPLRWSTLRSYPLVFSVFVWLSFRRCSLLLSGTRYRPDERGGCECDGPEAYLSPGDGGCGDGDQGWKSVTWFVMSAVPEPSVHSCQHTSFSICEPSPGIVELPSSVSQPPPDTHNDHSQETIPRTTPQVWVTTQPLAVRDPFTGSSDSCDSIIHSWDPIVKTSQGE
jgi:hypothetical protein